MWPVLPTYRYPAKILSGVSFLPILTKTRYPMLGSITLSDQNHSTLYHSDTIRPQRNCWQHDSQLSFQILQHSVKTVYHASELLASKTMFPIWLSDQSDHNISRDKISKVSCSPNALRSSIIDSHDDISDHNHVCILQCAVQDLYVNKYSHAWVMGSNPHPSIKKQKSRVSIRADSTK